MPEFNRTGTLVSVVIPVHNEFGAVGALHRETREALDGINHEIVIVDDGSTDGTAAILAGLDAVVVTLARNYGQTSAIAAGVAASRGAIIVTIDGDGQNDPADIPRLVQMLDEGWDVVAGWRKHRKDPPGKRLASRAARTLRNLLINDGIHDSGCTLKAYRADCFEDLELYGELHRFIPGMLLWSGRRITEIEVNHRPRTTGRTKYGWKRGIKGALDMIAVWFWRKFAQRPQHLFGGIGLLLLASGLVLTGTLAVLRAVGRIQLSTSILPLGGFFLILTGVQLLAFGLVSDVLFRTHHRVQGRPPYRVQSIRRAP